MESGRLPSMVHGTGKFGGYDTIPLPDSLHQLQERWNPGSTARGSPTPDITLTVEVCRRGHPGTHGTILDTCGPRAIHHKRAPRVDMHTWDDRIHPWEEAVECEIWIRHPLARGGRGETIWGKAEAILHWGGPPGSTQAAQHTLLVGKTQWGYAKCQQHHRQGGRPGVNAIWARLPSHSPGNLGGRPRQGPRPGVKSWCDGHIPPRNTPDVPCGRLWLHHPIGRQKQLHHHTHWYSTTDGMGGRTQVFCAFS